jgi:predicted esterase
MSRSRVAVVTLAIFAAVHPPAPAAKQISGELSARPAAPVNTTSAGRHRMRAGTTATLYLPEAIPAGASAPFLLLLHGAGGKGDDMIRKFKAQADMRGIILLAPDSADPTWDVAMSMSGNRWAPPSFGRDVKRIDTLLKEAFARVNVDPQFVAVAGFSDGASTALSIGARNAALFPVTLAFSAGGMVPDWTGPAGRVFFSHGAKDPILPIAIARDSLAPALSATGFAVTFVSFEGGHALPEPVLEQAMVWWLGR